jgi:TAT (twin-arginine translocation) pathway signal sequence
VKTPRSGSGSSGRLNRRHFLKTSGAASLAGAVALGQGPEFAAAAAPADPLLPTIKLGPHAVTRLIIGGNPIYGHSHFNRILSETMVAWHTPERVVELIRHAEAKGINTWQNSYTECTLSDLDRYRETGGKMHWLRSLTVVLKCNIPSTKFPTKASSG